MSPDQRPSLDGQELALRDDGGKLPIHLIPPEFILELAAIFKYGAEKYAPDNWKKGMNYSRMYSSAMRHLLAFWDGDDVDDESDRHHLAHAAWNCLALLWYTEHLDIHLDDREMGI